MSDLSPRAIRVGVLLGDSLVEEKVFRGNAPVTFGQSLKCGLSIPGDGIPHEHALFVHDEGRVLLRVTKTMTGKLAQAGEVQVIGGEASIPLAKGARGKLVLGDATILFQEIAAPPIAPRPVLPASIRGTIGDRIDRRLAAIIGASVVVHLGLAGYAWMQDIETSSLLESPVAQTYRQEVMEVTLPDETPPPAVTPEPAPGTATPVAPAQVSQPIVKRPTTTTTIKQEPGMSEDDAQRFASILTGSEVGKTGANDLNRRQPGADLEQQIDAVGDREVVVGNDQNGFRQKPREGLGTNPDGPRIDDPTQVANQQPKENKEPKGRIQIRPLPPEGPGTTLTVAMVLDKINDVYMPGLQRCYKKGLVDDAKLGGKVAVSFTVGERGQLEDGSARGVSTEVDACVGSFMQSWRFAIPRDKDGDPTDASFKLTLALQPG
jgi:hypothetical protein